MFVDPSYRGRGSAGELIRHCIVHAAADGYRALVMHVQVGHRAILALAESHGFVSAGKPDGTDQYTLRPLRLAVERSPTVERIGLVPAGPETTAPG